MQMLGFGDCERFEGFENETFTWNETTSVLNIKRSTWRRSLVLGIWRRSRQGAVFAFHGNDVVLVCFKTFLQAYANVLLFCFIVSQYKPLFFWWFVQISACLSRDSPTPKRIVLGVGQQIMRKVRILQSKATSQRECINWPISTSWPTILFKPLDGNTHAFSLSLQLSLSNRNSVF